MHAITRTYVWPKPQHEQLLKAIFLSDNAALHAWQNWQAQTAGTQLEIGTRQLLPLLYRKLLQLGVADSQLVTYKQHYRWNWAKNHHLLHKALPLLENLQAAGITPWVLKGTAMILLCYQDLALRPMLDCDVLVEPQQVLAAMELLMQQGWHPTSGYKLDAFTPQYFSIRHAHSFKNSDNCTIDLHWRISQGITIPFKQRSLPVALFNLPIQTLNFTDHLLHTCVHSVSEDVGKKLLWVCDAMFILQNNTAIDWPYLVDQARKFHVSLPLHDPLRYLQQRLDAPIPDDFFTELNKINIPRIIRNEYHYKIHPESRSFLGTLLRSWHQHARLTEFRNLGYRLLTYPRHLQVTWGVNSLWQLPAAGIKIIHNRFGKKK